MIFRVGFVFTNALTGPTRAWMQTQDEQGNYGPFSVWRYPDALCAEVNKLLERS